MSIDFQFPYAETSRMTITYCPILLFLSFMCTTVRPLATYTPSDRTSQINLRLGMLIGKDIYSREPERH